MKSHVNESWWFFRGRVTVKAVDDALISIFVLGALTVFVTI